MNYSKMYLSGGLSLKNRTDVKRHSLGMAQPRHLLWEKLLKHVTNLSAAVASEHTDGV